MNTLLKQIKSEKQEIESTLLRGFITSQLYHKAKSKQKEKEKGSMYDWYKKYRTIKEIYSSTIMSKAFSQFIIEEYWRLVNLRGQEFENGGDIIHPFDKAENYINKFQ